MRYRQGVAEPRKRRANGEASRQRILDAAAEIAGERGYEGTSIALVSERSGLPASSIYWHFTDKDALIAAVIERSYEEWLDRVSAWAPSSSDASRHDRMAAMMERTARTLSESGDFLRLGLMLSLERRPGGALRPADGSSRPARRRSAGRSAASRASSPSSTTPRSTSWRPSPWPWPTASSWPRRSAATPSTSSTSSTSLAAAIVGAADHLAAQATGSATPRR